MRYLLAVSRWIDTGTRLIGQSVAWLIVVAAVISAGNALVRKLFDISSNAWLELQWWLFAAVFLLAAPWTLALNEHIRIDIVNERFPRWLRQLIEVIGHVFFLLPMAAIVTYTSWDFFVTSYWQNEGSSNYGGLPQWPVKFLIPLAFALLFLQGVSELIKRCAIINGDLPDDGLDAGHPAGGALVRPPRESRPRRAASPALPHPARRASGTQGGHAGAHRREPRADHVPGARRVPAARLSRCLLALRRRPHLLRRRRRAGALLGGRRQPVVAAAHTLPERIFGVMTNDTLLAIPFFAFMGLILERSGMAEDLLETVGQLFGTVRGGLAYAVIFVGALLAATTGVVAASVISMGLISLPIMLRYGYDARFATGTIAASGTLAQIIPPSLVLIVLADQLGRSVGDMYTGALVPGLMLAGFYAVYVFIVSTIWKDAAPGLPPEAIIHREPDGSRGYPSLVALTAICGTVAWALMRRTTYTRRRPHHPHAWRWPSASPSPLPG